MPSTTSLASTGGWRRRALGATTAAPSTAPSTPASMTRAWWAPYPPSPRSSSSDHGPCGCVEKKGGEEGRVGVLDWPGAAGLKRHDGIGCRGRGPSAGIEVTSACVGRRSRLPMPQHRSKRRGGADGQAARPTFDSRCHAGPIRTWEDTGKHRACPRRRIGDPNLVDRCVRPDASVWLRRTAGACETGAPVRSDARTRCVGLLEMP
jgi:hypothetical protein